MYGLPLCCKKHFATMANTVAVMYPAGSWRPVGSCPGWNPRAPILITPAVTIDRFIAQADGAPIVGLAITAQCSSQSTRDGRYATRAGYGRNSSSLVRTFQ